MNKKETGVLPRVVANELAAKAALPADALYVEYHKYSEFHYRKPSAGRSAKKLPAYIM